MLHRGHTVGPFVIETFLGKGGIAEVYGALNRSTGSRHAIKVLTVHSLDLYQRLRQEGAVQAAIKHPNVAAVQQIMQTDGGPALVMERIDGPSLYELIHAHRPDTRDALQLFAGVVGGVGAAHEKGVVHRDLKPSNVLVHTGSDGLVPKVADFGLAKVLQVAGTHTETGVSFGSPAYMAPEQLADAKHIDNRADIYALGSVLYELLTGQPPFVGATLMDVLRLRAEGRPPPDPRTLNPAITPELVAAIHRLMADDPAGRPSSCAQILQEMGLHDRPRPIKGDLFHAARETFGAKTKATGGWATAEVQPPRAVAPAQGGVPGWVMPVAAAIGCFALALLPIGLSAVVAVLVMLQP